MKQDRPDLSYEDLVTRLTNIIIQFTVAAIENSDTLTTPNFWLCKWY
jgi:hypothetical protein